VTLSLEFVLATEKAVANIRALDTALANLKSRFGDLNAADASVAKLNTTLAGVQGINPAAAASITAVATALNKLGKNNALSSIATGLQQLSAVNVSAAANSVEQLAQALANIKAPRGLGSLGNNFAKIGNEARSGLSSVQSFAQTLNGIKSPPGVNQLRQQLGMIPPAAGQARSGVLGLTNSFSSMSSVLGALGLGAGISGLVNIGKAAMDAAVQFQQFETRLTATGQAPKVAAEQLAFVRKSAFDLAVPLDTALTSFSKLSIAMAASGQSAETTREVFTGFATGFRALGLTADQTERAFNAVNQMFTKGTVSMEELRQQLGEVFPAFDMLAKSLGVSGQELARLISEGKVSSQVLIQLAQNIKSSMGDAAVKASATGQAAIIRFSNALTELKAAAGRGIFDGLGQGLAYFTSQLQSPAIMQFANALGYVGGLLVGAFGGALVQVVNYLSNFVALVGAAVSSVVQLGQYIYGMLPSFGLWQQAIAFVLPPLQTLINLFGPFATGAAAVGLAMIGLSQTVRLLGTAISVLSNPITRTILIVGGLVAAVVTLGLVFTSLYQTMATGGNFAANFASNAAQLRATMDGVRASVLGASTASQQSGDSFGEASNAATQASAGIGELSSAAGDAQGELSGLQGPAEGLANAAKDVQQSASPAAQATGQLGDAAGGASGAVSSLSGSLDSSASSARSAAQAYREAAAAARELAAAKAQAGGGGGGGGGSEYSMFSGGGISHIGTTNTQSVQAEAFRSAPHFAGGTANTNGYAASLPGGGIPSILHPNEAVVPLAGGGAIPIAMQGGGGGGVPQSGPDPITIQLQQLETLRSMNTELNRLWEAVDANSVVLTNEFSKQNVILSSAVGALNNVTSAIGQVNITLANLRFGGSGSSGSGTGGSTGSSSGGTSGALLDAIKSYQTQKANLDYGYKYGNPNSGGGGIGYLGSDGKFYASYDYSPDKENNSRISQQKQNLLTQLFDQFGVASVVAKLFPNAGQDNMPGQTTSYLEHYQKLYDQQHPQFATGSPNASRDANARGSGSAGFTATLHDDEAVIPLPDGRSVPVALPRSFMDRTNDAVDGGSQRRPAINVTMNITTPDANSFRASKRQIMDELRGELDRTQRTQGPSKVSTVEDPTRRV
jgi:tape measure domain-containing protein